jgi:hypothetical protein
VTPPWPAALALAVLAAACTREPAPAPQASPPAETLAPAATTTTTTTTLPPPVWRTVRWGMSREEVLAALPGEAKRLPAPEAFGQPTPGAAEVAIHEMREGQHPYRTLFGFGPSGLDRIHMVAAKPTYDTCGEIERGLAAKHGAPSARNEIATSLRGEAVVWTLPAETITLACTERPSLGYRSVTVDHVPPSAASASR